MAKTILVVDDSSISRETMAFTLNGAGYVVIQAANGKDALDKLSIPRIDMVIADIDIPVMDGIAFTKQVRSDTRYRLTPIILLMPSYEELDREDFMQANINGWIVRPFSAKRLLRVVRLFMQKKH